MRKIDGADRYAKVSTWCMFASVAMLGIIMRPGVIPANATAVAALKAEAAK